MQTHHEEKRSNFAELSLLATYLALSRKAREREEKARSSWRAHIHTHTPVIELNVLLDRESRANWARRASSGDTRALFVAGSCQRAWYALLPLVRPSLAFTPHAACIRVHSHICTAGNLLDRVSVRLRIVCAWNWYWSKSIISINVID